MFSPGHLARCLALFVLLLPLATRANDTSISSEPGRVQVLKNRRVSMLSEHIELRYEGRCVDNRNLQGKWVIHARYRFENLSKKRQRVRLGFPESLCDPEFGDCAGDDPSFQDMVTRVRGEAVKHSIVELKATKKRNLGRIWAYWVKFKPRETVEVTHRFSVVGSIEIGGARGVSYLVETGKNWAKPIGFAQFKFLIPAQVNQLRLYPNQGYQQNQENGLVKRSIKYVQHQGKPMIELVYDAKNWVPKTTHVSIDFESPCYGESRLNPPTWDPKQRAEKLGQPGRYCLWSDLKLAYLDQGSAVDRLAESSSHLDTCIKAVRAMRGDSFSDGYDRAYFYANAPASTQAPAPAFRPNAAFSEAFLDRADKTAMERFEQAKRLRTKAPKSPAPAPTKKLPPNPPPTKPAPRSWCMLSGTLPHDVSALFLILLAGWRQTGSRATTSLL